MRYEALFLEVVERAWRHRDRRFYMQRTCVRPEFMVSGFRMETDFVTNQVVRFKFLDRLIIIVVQNSHMRYITPFVLEDLRKKMVFIGGPRQVGKTTLAKAILSNDFPNGRYLNWDFDEDRQDILKKRWSTDDTLLVFDELHKFPRWKTWVKGIYDVSHEMHSFLITGSARLDVYRRGGDSLMGRYHYWRLHPFTLVSCHVSNDYQIAQYFFLSAMYD